MSRPSAGETLTPWKEELLWRLYVDTYNFLTPAYGDEVIDRKQAALAELIDKRPPDLTTGEVEAFLEGLPRRYLQLFPSRCRLSARPAGARPRRRSAAGVARTARRRRGS